MKIDPPVFVWKRFLVFALVMVVILVVIDRILLNSKTEEKKSFLILEALQTHKVLSNELHSLLYGVQDDFNFFEKKILTIFDKDKNSYEYRTDVKSQIEFLETHAGYFKVRLTDSRGQELFKIIQKPSRIGFNEAKELFNLSGQAFYQELSKVQSNEFFFSSMDANIINGQVEIPLRPTVRVSKRVNFNKNSFGFLAFNIDGKRILSLFSGQNYPIDKNGEVILLDGEGGYVASYPLLSEEFYTSQKKSLRKSDPDLYKDLVHQHQVQGSLSRKGEIVVYSQFLLPNTTEKWLLISRVREDAWKALIHKDRLTWIFWEFVCLLLILIWLWRDEKKRHKAEVVQVLLKERSEFIQNVSHQLKTPLAIMINSLENKHPTDTDWFELKKEMHYLIKVVEDMLLLATVDARQSIPLVEEDVLEIVSEAVEMTGPKAKEKGVLVRFNVDENLLNSHLEKPVMGELLKSAIVNLIDNAIDFSPKGDAVQVLMAMVEGKLVIQVKDNGPGIPDEMVPRLFERFCKGSTPNRKSTGLGLSIAKKIIDLHRGEIVLVKHKGGTVFEIRL